MLYIEDIPLNKLNSVQINKKKKNRCPFLKTCILLGSLYFMFELKKKKSNIENKHF